VGTAAIQGELWGARAREWAELNEPAWRPVFEVAVEQAGAAPGKKLPDVGCGSGGALIVARRCGADVAGLDASANLVEIARQRVPGARIEVGEMEELPFADDMKKEDCELVSGTMAAIFALLPSDRPGAPPPRPLAEPCVIESLMRDAGLQPVENGEFPAALAFPDVETAIRAILSASARVIRHAGEEVVANAIRKTLPRFIRPDSSVVWNNRFRWVKATRA
jgi:SAM-dependent methyltransferase